MSKNETWEAEGLRDRQAAGSVSVHETPVDVEAAAPDCSCAATGDRTALRPLELVKMVVWKLNLRPIASAFERHAPMMDEASFKVELPAAMLPLYAAAAVDCRTGVVLGMTFAREPEASIATDCLQMVTPDKGLIFDVAGVAGAWSQYGIPEAVVVDFGALFSSSAFVTECRERGIAIKRGVSGPNATHDVIERRLQATLDRLLSTCSPLTSFTTVASALAPGAPDHVRMALVRRIVGIYHDTPQHCLGGKTPLEMWRDDYQTGNVPLRPALRITPRQVEQEGRTNG